MWARVKIHMNLILTNLYNLVFVEFPPKMYVGFLCQVSAVHSSYKKELLSQLKCTRCSLNVELNWMQMRISGSAQLWQVTQQPAFIIQTNILSLCWIPAVTDCHFRMLDTNSDFWDPSHIWPEWCQDKKLKRQQRELISVMSGLGDVFQLGGWIMYMSCMSTAHWARAGCSGATLSTHLHGPHCCHKGLICANRLPGIPLHSHNLYILKTWGLKILHCKSTLNNMSSRQNTMMCKITKLHTLCINPDLWAGWLYSLL